MCFGKNWSAMPSTRSPDLMHLRLCLPLFIHSHLVAYHSTISSTQVAAAATWKALYAFAEDDVLAAGVPHPAASEAAPPENGARPQSPEASQTGAVPVASAPAAAAATLAQE